MSKGKLICREGAQKGKSGGSHLLPVFNNNSYPGSSAGFVILMMPLIEHLRAIRAQSDNCITIGRSTVSVGCQITGGMMIGLSVRDNSYLGCLLFIYLLIMNSLLVSGNQWRFKRLIVKLPIHSFHS